MSVAIHDEAFPDEEVREDAKHEEQDVAGTGDLSGPSR